MTIKDFVGLVVIIMPLALFLYVVIKCRPETKPEVTSGPEATTSQGQSFEEFMKTYEDLPPDTYLDTLL